MPTLTQTEAACWAVVVVVAGVHLSSYLPFSHIELRTVVPLLFLPMATFTLMCAHVIPLGREHLDAALTAAPRWVKPGFYLTFAYALLTFWINAENYHGTPKIVDSAFVLTDHGRVVHTITEAEYWRLARAEVRFAFGFVLTFAYWAAAGYTFARKPIGDERNTDTPP